MTAKAEYHRAYINRRRARLLASGATRPSDTGRKQTKTTYLGVPCKRGHSGERFTSGHCVQCQREKIKHWMRKARANKHPVTAKQAQWTAKWQKKNLREYQKARRQNPSIAMVENLRCRMRDVLKGRSKAGHTLELLGTTPEGWKEWLAKQFTPEMTWENYGTVWHIDHLVPISRYDLSDPEKQRLVFHYTNTRPLLAEDNMRRGNRVSLADLL